MELLSWPNSGSFAQKLEVVWGLVVGTPVEHGTRGV
jgi:hypothetical protein